MSNFSGMQTDEIKQEFVNGGLRGTDVSEMFDWFLEDSTNFIKYTTNDVPEIVYDRELEDSIHAVDDLFKDEVKLRDFDSMFEDAFDDYWVNQPPKSKGGLIGCDYQGVKDIKERETSKVFIPSGVDCIFKAYQRYFDDKKINTNLYELFKKNKKSLPVKGISMIAFNKIMKELGLEEYLLPNYKLWVDKNEVKSSDKCNKIKVSDYFIGFLYLGHGTYHAILVKGKSPIAAKLSIDDIKIEFCIRKDLVCRSRYLPKPKPKTPNQYVVAYDIETYLDTSTTPNVLIPVSLGWALVDLKESSDSCIIHTEIISEYDDWKKLYDEMFKQVYNKLYVTVQGNLPKDIKLYAHNGSRFDNIFVKLLDKVHIKSCIKSGNQYKTITVTTKIAPKIEFVFRDSLPFTLASLKRSCAMFNTDITKVDFDIIDKSKEWFKENDTGRLILSTLPTFTTPDRQTNENVNDHMIYLKYDVWSLAKLLMNIETQTMQMGMSITNFIGLPGMSFYLLRRNCFGMKDIRIPDHPTICKFIKESIYGGRVLQWKTHFPSLNLEERKLHGESLISVDMNSLYPSAMYASGFPVGDFHLLLEDELNFDLLNEKYPHYIIECDIEIPNIRYPIHPYKKEIVNKKGERVSTCLIYPTNQTITGVYNDVDIREMLKDGYKVVNVKKGIYWVDSKRIFNDLIEQLYSKRCEFKAMKGAERNKEYIFKILLNAMYGKFNESIRDVTTYRNDDGKENVGTEKLRSQKLPNGQFEIISKHFHTKYTKPTHIASYILSHSRAIVNELIRTVEAKNVYYSDTDSIYIPRNIFEKCDVEGRLGKMNDGTILCGFKNDYGDNTYIEEAVFLDMKRYYLKKSNTSDGVTKKSISLKFNGLNFKNLTHLTSIIEEDLETVKVDVMENDQSVGNRDECYKNLITNLYQAYYVNNEKYSEVSKNGIKLMFHVLDKNKYGIFSIDRHVGFTISPKKRGQWINSSSRNSTGGYSEFYGLGYNLDNPEHIPEMCKKIGSYVEKEQKKFSIKYSIYNRDGRKLIKSSQIPIRLTNYCDDIKRGIKPFVKQGFESNYYNLSKDPFDLIYYEPDVRAYYKKEDTFEDKLKGNTYRFNAYGITTPHEITPEELKVMIPVILISFDKNEYKKYTDMFGINILSDYDLKQIIKMI